MTERQEEYREYLESEWWHTLRAQCFERDRWRCRVCNSSHQLNAHHRKYPQVFGDETLDDLTTLCRQCHSLYHDSGLENVPHPILLGKRERRRMWGDLCWTVFSLVLIAWLARLAWKLW